MTIADSNIFGMPCFPGVAVGKLQRVTAGDIAHRIVMVTQDAITAFDTLPA